MNWREAAHLFSVSVHDIAVSRPYSINGHRKSQPETCSRALGTKRRYNQGKLVTDNSTTAIWEAYAWFTF